MVIAQQSQWSSAGLLLSHPAHVLYFKRRKLNKLKKLSNLNMEAQREHLTTHQVSRLLEVSPTTVINWVRTGQLACYTTLGGHRRIEREVLEAFLKEHAMPIPVELHPQSSKRILVVDDDPDILDVMKATLETQPDFEVKAVKDGFEAGVEVALWKPDLLVLDVLMPGLNGYEVAALLKNSPRTRHLPILAVTGLRQEVDIDSVRRAGVTDILQKPFTADDLLAKIRALLAPAKSGVPSGRRRRRPPDDPPQGDKARKIA